MQKVQTQRLEHQITILQASSSPAKAFDGLQWLRACGSEGLGVSVLFCRAWGVFVASWGSGSLCCFVGLGESLWHCGARGVFVALCGARGVLVVLWGSGSLCGSAGLGEPLWLCGAQSVFVSLWGFQSLAGV